MLTEVERRRVHVPEEAKVVVGDELSAECCGNYRTDTESEIFCFRRPACVQWPNPHSIEEE